MIPTHSPTLLSTFWNFSYTLCPYECNACVQVLFFFFNIFHTNVAWPNLDVFFSLEFLVCYVPETLDLASYVLFHFFLYKAFTPTLALFKIQILQLFRVEGGGDFLWTQTLTDVFMFHDLPQPKNTCFPQQAHN